MKKQAKDWKKIILYLIPIIALVVANALNIDDPSEIEDSLNLLFASILGVLSAIGVYANNDKSEENTDEPDDDITE